MAVGRDQVPVDGVPNSCWASRLTSVKGSLRTNIWATSWVSTGWSMRDTFVVARRRSDDKWNVNEMMTSTRGRGHGRTGGAQHGGSGDRGGGRAVRRRGGDRGRGRRPRGAGAAPVGPG